MKPILGQRDSEMAAKVSSIFLAFGIHGIRKSNNVVTFGSVLGQTLVVKNQANARGDCD
jgi:hypothetical protein